MNEMMRHHGSRILKLASVLLVVFIVFFGVKTLETWRAYRLAHYAVTVDVSGMGELFTKPDIAAFSYSATAKAKTVAEAQKQATKIANDSIAFLKKNGVAEKDIKTENYSFYPQYEYVQERICVSYPCVPGPGKQVITGYEVSQAMRVKVRDLDKVGELVSGMGSLGVSNLGSVEFTIEDEQKVQAEARALAIENAREKAYKLARDLGLRVVRIAAFSEAGFHPTYQKFATDGFALERDTAAANPEIPVGENKIVSNVVVTYELR